MISIRQILDKIFPKLNAIEEAPTVIVVKSTTSGSEPTNPFDPNDVEQYNNQVTVPCIYSEQPEMVTSNNNLVIQQTMYLYIQQKDMPELTLHDRFIFNNKRYRPLDIQNLFGLWRVKVLKE